MKTGLKNTLAAALLSMGLASGAQAAGVSDTEIVLGTHLDLSGPVAAGMPSIRNGMQMRLDEANDAGGVNGRKFRLVVEDNGSQPQMAVRAMDKLSAATRSSPSSMRSALVPTPQWSSARSTRAWCISARGAHPPSSASRPATARCCSR